MSSRYFSRLGVETHFTYGSLKAAGAGPAEPPAGPAALPKAEPAAADFWLKGQNTPAWQGVLERLGQAGIRPRQGKTVVAVRLTASADEPFFITVPPTDWAQATWRLLEQEFGADNLVTVRVKGFGFKYQLEAILVPIAQGKLRANELFKGWWPSSPAPAAAGLSRRYYARCFRQVRCNYHQLCLNLDAHICAPLVYREASPEDTQRWEKRQQRAVEPLGERPQPSLPLPEEVPAPQAWRDGLRYVRQAVLLDRKRRWSRTEVWLAKAVELKRARVKLKHLQDTRARLEKELAQKRQWQQAHAQSLDAMRSELQDLPMETVLEALGVPVYPRNEKCATVLWPDLSQSGFRSFTIELPPPEPPANQEIPGPPSSFAMLLMCLALDQDRERAQRLVLGWLAHKLTYQQAAQAYRKYMRKWIEGGLEDFSCGGTLPSLTQMFGLRPGLGGELIERVKASTGLVLRPNYGPYACRSCLHPGLVGWVRAEPAGVCFCRHLPAAVPPRHCFELYLGSFQAEPFQVEKPDPHWLFVVSNPLEALALDALLPRAAVVVASGVVPIDSLAEYIQLRGLPVFLVRYEESWRKSRHGQLAAALTARGCPFQGLSPQKLGAETGDLVGLVRQVGASGRCRVNLLESYRRFMAAPPAPPPALARLAA